MLIFRTLELCLHQLTFTFETTKMAEASAVPTFKLVLVGDGGTGKVGIPAILA